MSIDTWGIVFVLIGGIGYFLSKKSHPELAKFELFLAGIGVGMLVAAAYMVSAINQILGA